MHSEVDLLSTSELTTLGKLFTHSYLCCHQ